MKKLVFVFVIIGIFGGILLVRQKKAKLAAALAPTARPTPVRIARAKTGTLCDIRNYLARLNHGKRQSPRTLTWPRGPGFKYIIKNCIKY